MALILILTGTPGIGKTHLALAALNEARQKGMPTYYITYAAFSSTSYKERQQLLEKIQHAPGLLAIDDYNASYDQDIIEFIKTLHKTSGTSILITSNESLGDIRNQLPFGNNIVICEGNTDITQRKPWWTAMGIASIAPALMPLDRCCGMLLVHKGKEINLEKIKADLLEKRKEASLPPLNIKIAGNPFDEKRQRYVMPELYFQFKENDSIDMLIIKVTNQDECKQLLNAVGSAWELNRKIIVLCEDESAFLALLEPSLFHNADKERLKARLDMILLTPSILAAMPVSSVLPANKPVNVSSVSVFHQPKNNVTAEQPKPETPVVVYTAATTQKLTSEQLSTLLKLSAFLSSNPDIYKSILRTEVSASQSTSKSPAVAPMD